MRTYDLAVSTGFSLFVSAPLLAWLFGVRAEAFENKSLAEFPDAAPSAFLEKRFYKGVSRYFTDHMPMRPELVVLDSWIDWHLWGDCPTREVVVGSDRWLFLKGTLLSGCKTPRARSDFAFALEWFGATAAAHGKEFRCYLAPCKESIYAEMLPRLDEALQACLREQERFRTELVASPPQGFFELWTELRGLRADPLRAPFPPFGHHPQFVSAEITARAVVESLAPGLWDPGAVKKLPVANFPAELPERFMRLSIPEEREPIVVERPGVHVEELEPLGLDTPNARFGVPRFAAHSDGPLLLPGRTLIVHDSFLELVAPLLAPYCEELYLAHWEDTHMRQIVPVVVAACDRVIFERVEYKWHMVVDELSRPTFREELATALAAGRRDLDALFEDPRRHQRRKRTEGASR